MVNGFLGSAAVPQTVVEVKQHVKRSQHVSRARQEPQQPDTPQWWSCDSGGQQSTQSGWNKRVGSGEWCTYCHALLPLVPSFHVELLSSSVPVVSQLLDIFHQHPHHCFRLIPGQPSRSISFLYRMLPNSSIPSMSLAIRSLMLVMTFPLFP